MSDGLGGPSETALASVVRAVRPVVGGGSPLPPSGRSGDPCHRRAGDRLGVTVSLPAGIFDPSPRLPSVVAGGAVEDDAENVTLGILPLEAVGVDGGWWVVAVLHVDNGSGSQPSHQPHR